VVAVKKDPLRSQYFHLRMRAATGWSGFFAIHLLSRIGTSDRFAYCSMVMASDLFGSRWLTSLKISTRSSYSMMRSLVGLGVLYNKYGIMYK